MFPAHRVEGRGDADICTRLATPKPPLLLGSSCLAPKFLPADIEGVVPMFNTHIQDVLLVACLANTTRTQIDLSNELANVNFGATIPTLATAAIKTTATSATPTAGRK